MEQNIHIGEALRTISFLKRDFDILTIEGMFNWILEVRDELVKSEIECDKALQIIDEVTSNFDTLTSDYIFNQILKVEELIKAK